jgi:hypothetical protein
MPLVIEELNEDAPPQDFAFHYLPDVSFNSCGSQSVQPLLDKWGFGPDMCMCTFRVEQPIRADNIQSMLDSFFRDKNVIHTLHHRTGVRVLSPDKTRVRWDKMSTQVVSMSFFNKFQECGAIGHTGHIRGRLEEDFEGVPINNLVREVMLCEESEMYDAFTENERKEFLYRIFQALVFGGASNQWEDHVEEYFRVTKDVYKDLLTVRRNDTGDVQVVSTVAQILSLGHGGSLFPKESPLNFCYVILDPMTRQLRVWYFGYRPLW